MKKYTNKILILLTSFVIMSSVVLKLLNSHNELKFSSSISATDYEYVGWFKI